MNITRVQIYIMKTPGSIKAMADIILDDDFIVRGLAIREDREGFAFVTMPFRLKEIDHDLKRQDIAHPLNEKCRKYLQTAVLDEYERVLNLKAPHETTRP
jgi:DNA-binding cell septation regulator SpoVG